jgi:hypothetical protein
MFQLIVFKIKSFIMYCSFDKINHMCCLAAQGPKVNAVPAGIFVQDNTFKFDNEKEPLQAVSFLFLVF